MTPWLMLKEDDRWFGNLVKALRGDSVNSFPAITKKDKDIRSRDIAAKALNALSAMLTEGIQHARNKKWP